MKSYSRFTSELTTRAWAIRRSLASLNGVAVMAISWKECITRASLAIRIAAAKSAYEAEQAEYDARVYAASAAHRAIIAAHPDSAYAEDSARGNRRVFG